MLVVIVIRSTVTMTTTTVTTTTTTTVTTTTTTTVTTTTKFSKREELMLIYIFAAPIVSLVSPHFDWHQRLVNEKSSRWNCGRDFLANHLPPGSLRTLNHLSRHAGA